MLDAVQLRIEFHAVRLIFIIKARISDVTGSDDPSKLDYSLIRQCETI